MPEYKTYLTTGPYPLTNPLPNWYSSRSSSALGYELLCRLFEWDPAKRITARETLQHAWFQEEGGVAASYVFSAVDFFMIINADRSVFEGSSITYPSRRVTHEDNGDAKMGS
jgi:cyclin-dependent kinase 8/11